MKQVVIHTDGACSGNPGPGGWGAILSCAGAEKEIFGHDDATTNNRMEMLAAISALESLKSPCDVQLFTDSKYLLQGATEWMKGWKARGWKTADKKPVKNQDLWERLELAMKPHRIKWNWVRGHNGDPLNERADQLATAAIIRR